MKMTEFSKRVKNTVGKEEIARSKQFLLFPVFLNDMYCRHVKTRACLGKGQYIYKQEDHDGPILLT